MAQIGSYYTFSESSGTYTEITGGTVSTASGDDGEETGVAIGFNFDYVGTTYTTVTIGVNGAISFTSANIDYVNNLASTDADNLDYIAPLWDDMYARTDDNVEISYETAGTAPNRTFTVQWKNISWRNTGSTVNFQIVLFEGSNNIVFNYGINNSTEARTASIGLNVSPGGVNNFISVTPGSPATTSTTSANNSISTADYPGDGHSYLFTYAVPACPAPTAQTVTNITTTGADLGWTDASGSHWDIYVVPTGDPAPTQTTTPTADDVTDNPYTWTGGAAATTYDWYVRSDCDQDNTGTSVWVGPSTFTTACNTFLAPFSENFASSSTPTCWDNSGTESWLFSTGAGYGASSAGDHTTGGGTNYAWIDGSGGVGVNALITPFVDVSGLTTPSIEFYYFSNNTDNPGDNNTLTVDFWDGATWDTLLTYTGDSPNWIQGLYDISAYTITGDIQVRFSVTGTAGTTYYNDILIDDVKVRELPSCLDPSAQTVTNITTSGADLGWTDTNGSYWDIYVVPTGDPAPTQTTTPTADDITDNPYTWTGGTASTTYDWYVRSDCDQNNTGTSAWVGPSTFTTACAAVSPPWSESFEGMTSVGSGVIPNCMAEDGDWATADAAQSYNRSARTGSNYIYTNWSADDWLYSVPIDLTAGTSYDFSFWYVTDGNSGWTTVEAKYGTGQTSADMTMAIGTPVSDPTNTTYTEYRGSFTPATSGTYYMGIHVVANSSPWYITFDDLLVEESPSCSAPTNQTETNISGYQADLGWTTGGSNEWQIEWDTAGFTQGTGHLVITTNNPYTLTGLDPTTSYDWYVRDICGAGDTSTWTGVHTFTTTVACPAPTDQTETNITTTSADLGWTQVGTSTSWDIRIGLAGYDTASNPSFSNTSNNPLTVDTLTVNTEYDWYVRSACGSTWTGPHTFKTMCDPTDIPYFQNFDAVIATNFPNCMTVEDANGDNIIWKTSTDGLSAPNAARISYNSNLDMDDWFFTKGLNLTGGLTYEVSFAYKSSTSFPEKLAVDWGDAASSTAMSGTPIFDNDNILGGWYAGSGTFSPTTDGIYYVGFHGYSNMDEFYILVDDIKVVEQVATTTWTGASGNDWDTISNWNSGLPSSTTVVTIPTGLTNYPTVNSATTIDSLVIESNASGDASILNDGLLIVTTNATVQRYTTAGVWHDYSASVQNVTLNDLYLGGSPDVWITHYNENDNSRAYLTTTTDTLDVGAGYELWVGGSAAVTYNFTGTLNRGDVALTSASTPALSYTGADPLGYNLIGNPFASPIALDSGAWNMANVDSTFWVWSSTLYKDYNTTTKTGSLTGGIIPMGQGFFIHANAASPTITIPMAARVHSSQAYYKSTRSNDLDMMKLRAMFDNDQYDELNILFIDGADELFESRDTRKMFAFNGNAPQVYAIIPDEELSQNSLPALNPGDERTVAVGYKAGVNGNQTLVADLSSLPETDVVLEDLRLNEFQNLNNNPVYTFEATTYQDPDRFRLHFNRSITGIDANSATSSVRAYSFEKSVYIVSNKELSKQKKELTIYDMMGRTMVNKTLPPGDIIRVPVNASNAYVVVRVISNGEVYTTKVFIK